MTQDFKVVGSRVPLVDAWKKVSGAAAYGDDVRFPGTLLCRLLRSTLPHAKILRIDASRAEAMPGVRAVVTGRDAQAKFGVLPISQDEEALARAREASALLAELGVIDEGETLVRLVLAEALRRRGLVEEGNAAAKAAREALLARADKIRDPRWRKSFLEKVPENARTMALP